MVIEQEKHKNFRIVAFRDVNYWDYYNLTKQGEFNSKYQIVSLGKVLKHRKEFISINDTEEYKRCRVQLYGNGIILRDIVRGNEIKTKKQQRCKTDDFLVAEIDAKFGGYGIVPGNLSDAIVSGHYFLYEIDRQKVLPEYLALVVKFKNFSKQVKATGSTNYAAIRPYDVLGYKIPLAPLSEQKKLVDKYHEQVQLAEEQEKEAMQLEDKIEKRICDLLGITIEQSEIKKGFNIFTYKEITKWSVDFILKQGGLSSLKRSIFPVISLGQIIDYLQYGISEKSNVVSEGTVVLRMNNIQNRKISLEKLKHYNFETSKLNKEKVLLRKGDLLFNRTNSKELVGKSAVFDLEGEYTFASYIIRLRFNKEVNPFYVNFVLNSKIGRLQIDLASRQILGQANINSEELKEILLPVPALEIQNKIVNELNNIISLQQELSYNAEQNKSLAMKKFEQSIFTN